MRRSINIWKGLDKVTVLIFLALIIMGWFNIYAAVYNEDEAGILNLSQRYGKQFVWIVATIVLAVFIVIIDTRFYVFFAWFIYAGLILLLLLVLIIGKEVNGAKSWFEFGPVSLQPSEFAKFATALALAAYLSSKKHDLTKVATFLTASAVILFPATLILLQPDTGSAVVFLALYIVLFREGLSPYIFVAGLLMAILFFVTLLFENLYITIALILVAFLLTLAATRKQKVCFAGLGILIVTTGIIYLFSYFVLKIRSSEEMIILVSLIISGLFYGLYIYNRKAVSILIIYLYLVGSLLFLNSVQFAFNNLLKPHQKERVEIMLGFKSDPHGTGYNLNQSLISIGSGGFSGKGYLQGTQTKFKFVPAQSTDFIFCTVGEEWGFLGSLVVVALFTFFLLRLVFLAERQKSVFPRIYGYGVIAVFFVHFFINIGMAIGLLPVVGIPLPFFSYGGSSLWGFTILLFIFLRFDASRNEYLI